ncbi:urotensin-2 receptor-like [Numida meleagris]|uniref:urotensin-2 receptor-like n=1 Tax=Numida meleagris TaxID=8996 RepID=UPI000B3DA301|nr:urotensin-2 receptor-like [Numida meleagris]
MEPGACTPGLCQPKNSSTQLNATSDSASDLLATSFLGCILGTMCVVGAAGNIYTLVVTTVSMRRSGSMYVYIINLALADLLYLSTIPFVVCTYFVRDWYFGDLGCRILFSLDLLTMHASIFILTIMSTERYLAVARPLATLRGSRDRRRVLTFLAWLAAFLLALPSMILIDLRTSHRHGVTKRMCHPTWRMGPYKVYLTVLFNTCILAPGITICCVYTKLARTYWRSQRALVAHTKHASHCPKQKVLYMIFSIVLAYWACFVPFWLWQLFSLYWHERGDRDGSAIVPINFLVTCLAYSNSCVNPFLYTLLSKNYSEYLRRHHRAAQRGSSAQPPAAVPPLGGSGEDDCGL